MATIAFVLTTFAPLCGAGGIAGYVLGSVPRIRLGLRVIGLMKSIGGRDGLSPAELARLTELESNPSAAQRFLMDDWP